MPPRQLHRGRQPGQSHANLCDDQCGPRRAERYPCPTTQRAECGGQDPASGLQRWYQAGNQRGQHAEAGDEEGGAPREAEVHPERERAVQLREAPDDLAYLGEDRACEGERHGSRRRGEHEHLHAQLHHDATAARAERVTRGELLLARDRSCVDEDGDVQAWWHEEQGDEKQDDPLLPRQLPALDIVGKRKGIRHNAWAARVGGRWLRRAAGRRSVARSPAAAALSSTAPPGRRPVRRRPRAGRTRRLRARASASQRDPIGAGSSNGGSPGTRSPRASRRSPCGRPRRAAPLGR